MESQNQPGTRFTQGMTDARRHPRFRLNVDIRIDSRTAGVLKGRSVDISESGISAMLKLEVPVGEFVELQFVLPFGPVRVYATVRQRNAFRYGFQFVESHSAHKIIQETCRWLSVAQSLRRAR
ncbi:MAG: PilZ domain-containing protein [Candidatus Sulfotelmatobacter sp.]